MENVFTLWKTGYAYQSAVSARLVKETEKAVQYQLLDNEKVTLWFPKAALKADKNESSILVIARWFEFSEYGRAMWSAYASVYKR